MKPVYYEFRDKRGGHFQVQWFGLFEFAVLFFPHLTLEEGDGTKNPLLAVFSTEAAKGLR
jgi:hypothetical protein